MRQIFELRSCDHCGAAEHREMKEGGEFERAGWGTVALLVAVDGEPKQVEQQICAACTEDLSSWLASTEDSREQGSE